MGYFQAIYLTSFLILKKKKKGKTPRKCKKASGKNNNLQMFISPSEFLDKANMLQKVLK